MLIGGAATLIAAIAIGVVVTVMNSRESALVGSERELANTAFLLSKDIDQKIGELESIRTIIAEDVKSGKITSVEEFNREMSSEDIGLHLKHRIEAFSFIDNLAIINSSGIIVGASSGRDSLGIKVADREFFKALKSNLSSTFYVSEPLRGRIGGQWKIIIAWKLLAPNGKFLGVISAAIRLAYFENYFQSIALGNGSLINLQRDDGTILVRFPRIERVIGHVYDGMTKALRSREQAVTRLTGKMENKQLILAAYRLHNYPLFVTAGMDSAFALDAWWKQAKVLIALGTAASLLIAIMVVIIVRQMSRSGKQFQKKIDEQAAQLNVAFSHMSHGLVMFDASAQLVICNDRYRTLYDLPADLAKPGCPLEDLIRYRVAKGTLPGTTDEFIRDLRIKLCKGETTQHEITLNDDRIISIKNEPLPWGGWVGTHDDITDKRRAELELDEAKKFLDLIIENTPVAIVVKDAKTRKFLLANRKFESLIGLSRDKLLGLSVFDIHPKADAELIDEADREALEIGTSVKEYDFELQAHHGQSLDTVRFVVRDNRGNAKYLIVVISDITERKEAERQVWFMAHNDALTGLANRFTLAQRIENAAARQRRSEEPFNVLLLDIDRFKQVNDTLGHPAGDALLREVAARIKPLLREMDTFARLGGDEFAILQTVESDQREAARRLAQRINDSISEPFNIEGNEVNVAASIGIALAPEHATDHNSLLKMADLALYRAKARGRNRYCFFDCEMGETMAARRVLENDLRRALQQDEFKLFYQPIIDLKTRKICGAEALIRWQHPTKGLVLPDQFIPLAEDTGLITQIGEWVLYTACKDAASWPEEVMVAVNLSAVQFRKSNLSDVVMYALAESGLSPERLELEITETALIKSTAECLPALRQFRKSWNFSCA